jgi:hypothetical protein
MNSHYSLRAKNTKNAKNTQLNPIMEYSFNISLSHTPSKQERNGTVKRL